MIKTFTSTVTVTLLDSFALRQMHPLVCNNTYMHIQRIAGKFCMVRILEFFMDAWVGCCQNKNSENLNATYKQTCYFDTQLCHLNVPKNHIEIQIT